MSAFSLLTHDVYYTSIFLSLVLALTAVGILLRRVSLSLTGAVLALAVLAFGSAAAGNEFKWGEALLMTAFMTVLSVAVFIWGLGLPYSLIKGF